MAFSDKEKAIIDWSLQNGKSPSEIRAAVARFRITGSPKQEVQEPEPQEDTFFSRASERVSEAGEQVFKNIAGEDEFGGQSSLRRGTQATAAAFNAIPAVALEALPEKPRTFLKSVGEKIGEGFKTVTDFFGNNEAIIDWVQKNPQAAQQLEEAAGTLSAGGQISGTILGADVTSKALQAGVNMGSRFSQEAVQQAQNTLSLAQNARTKLQSYMGGKSVDPKFKTAFSQDSKIGNPVEVYNKYVSQAKSAVDDIKADPPLAVIGEKVGDSFRGIVQTRRNVGAQMAEELQKVGNIKVNTLDVSDDLISQLRSNGVLFDRVAKTLKPLGKQTKLAADDMKLLETYSKELQGLGSKPSVSDIDAFLSRISSDLSLYKQKLNIVGTTNAERIIKGSLNTLRSKLSPTSNPALKGYADARALYSELSDFVKEGQQYLGKVTQSGDFARDASLVKSSVQSLLNNGKKDWLIKLEGYTGYPVLDDAVMALQAMKDVGDFRGLSLLETLADGTPPVTTTGLAQKLVNYGIDKAAKVVAGTPEEQTRAFLSPQSIKPSIKNPTQTNAISSNQGNIATKAITPAASMSVPNIGTIPYDTIEQTAEQVGLTPEKVQEIIDTALNFTPMGATKAVTRIGGKLLADDAKALTSYIDAVRLGKEAPESILGGAEAILTKLGANLEWSAKKLADFAEDIMSGKVDSSKLYKTGRDFNQKTAGQLKNEELLQKAPKPGSTEEILERGAGWAQGDKVIFDTAIKNKDVGTIFEMLRSDRIPPETAKRFMEKIGEILGPRLHEIK